LTNITAKKARNPTKATRASMRVIAIGQLP
jgi:hypothetical protein